MLAVARPASKGIKWLMLRNVSQLVEFLYVFNNHGATQQMDHLFSVLEGAYTRSELFSLHALIPIFVYASFHFKRQGSCVLQSGRKVLKMCLCRHVLY